jgi:hypothetical protein
MVSRGQNIVYFQYTVKNVFYWDINLVKTL